MNTELVCKAVEQAQADLAEHTKQPNYTDGWEPRKLKELGVQFVDDTEGMIPATGCLEFFVEAKYYTAEELDAFRFSIMENSPKAFMALALDLQERIQGEFGKSALVCVKNEDWYPKLKAEATEGEESVRITMDAPFFIKPPMDQPLEGYKPENEPLDSCYRRPEEGYDPSRN